MDPGALLLANPHAGRADAAAVGAVCRAVTSEWTLEVAVTEHPDRVPAVLDRLDGRRLLLMGGDGTLNVVLGELHRRRELATTPVGFVPAGTANAFARGIGLPLHPPTAAIQALAGHAQPIDLFVGDDEHVAVNDLHTGLGIPATHLSRRLKPVLRQLTYPVANSLVGLRSPGWEIGVSVDGEALVPESDRVLAVAIGNTEVLGDGTRVWPGASPDDGEADVVALLASRRWRRVGTGLALRNGQHLERDDVRWARGRCVVLHGDVPGHNADGELVSPPALRWRVEPDAWHLLRSRPASGPDRVLTRR